MKAVLRLKGKIRPRRKLSVVSYQPSALSSWQLVKYCALDNIRYLRSFLQFILVFVSCSAALAQESAVHATPAVQAEVITGIVSSAETGEPLEGATVKIKNSNFTASTNEKGEFTLISQSREGVLEVSFLGYQSKEVSFNNTTQTMVISLEEDQGMLEEVEINTGYQQVPEERATGSFAWPDRQMFENRVSTDIISRLKGITSGVLFNREGGVNIRGQSTIFANDQPLIIVDNFPYSGDIENINPNDVANITILKDAAAASIWGARAGNGVIVITTKSGKESSPLKVSFSSNVTIFKKPDLFYAPNYFSSSNYIEVEQFLFDQNVYNNAFIDDINYKVISPVVHLLSDRKNNTLSQEELNRQLNEFRKQDVRNDMLNYFYRNALNIQNSINFTGGSDKTTYYFGSGYDKNLSSLKENSFDRITLSTLNTIKPVTNLTLNFGINYNQNKTTTDNTLSTTTNGMGFYPYTSFTDSNNEPSSIYLSYDRRYVDEIAPEKGFLDWSYYPLNELGLTDNTTKSNDIRINTGLQFNVIKGLEISGKYQYQNYRNTNRLFNSQETYSTRNTINRYAILKNEEVSGYNISVGGILNQINTSIITHNVRGQVTYANKWDLHELNTLAGLETTDSKKGGDYFSLYGYDNDITVFQVVDYVSSFPTNPSGYSRIPNYMGISGGVDRFRSVFGNIGYVYNNKYTMSASARIDGSNYFGVATNQKNVPLWSMGAKWDIDNEKFYRSSLIPYLKIKASYGYNGNLEKGITGMTTFGYRSNASLTGLKYATISNYGNPELRWEKIAIMNLGVEFKSSKDILNGSIDIFYKKGTDLIGDKPFAPSSGLMNLRGNYSQLRSNGFDLQLTSKNIKKSFLWNSTLLVSYVNDEVTKYDVEAIRTLNYLSSSNYPIVGKPVYGLFSFRWAGLDPETGDPRGYDSNREISKDYSELNSKTDINDLIFHGRIRPAYFGGLVNSFHYRNWSINLNISFKLGHYFRRPALLYNQLFSGNTILGSEEYSLRWNEPGDEQFTNVPSINFPVNLERDQFYQYSEVTVEKADHIRLQDINLSYSFKKLGSDKASLRDMKIYLYANNVGLIWKATKTHYDPDFISSSGSALYSFPLSTSFAIGMSINL